MAGTKERKEQRLKLFVEHYLQHGEASAAARAAGYNGTPGSVKVRGSRLLTEANQRGLLGKAREVVLAKVRKGTVATLEEALGTATDIMRGRLGRFITEDGAVDLRRIRKAKAGLVRKYEVSESMRQKRGEDAEVWDRKTRFELESSLSAAKTLIDFHAPKEGPITQTQVNVLNVIPPELSAQLYRALIRPNGNGNGSHA